MITVEKSCGFLSIVCRISNSIWKYSLDENPAGLFDDSVKFRARY